MFGRLDEKIDHTIFCECYFPQFLPVPPSKLGGGKSKSGNKGLAGSGSNKSVGKENTGEETSLWTAVGASGVAMSGSGIDMTGGSGSGFSGGFDGGAGSF